MHECCPVCTVTVHMTDIQNHMTQIQEGLSADVY